jgi:ectoine hydroxylase-related dioxygenase (phytanoyl-CoA dioxygenase family)
MVAACGVVSRLPLRCLHFIPGSHRWGLIGPTRGNEGTEHPMSEDFMSDTERWPAVPVPLRPGSVSFHHSMTMHKSGANTSGLRRRGYAIHYMRATSVPQGEITAGAKVRAMGHSLPRNVVNLSLVYYRIASAQSARAN